MVDAVQCAWCRRFKKGNSYAKVPGIDGIVLSFTVKDGEERVEHEVSHGICPVCDAKQRARHKLVSDSAKLA